MSTYKLHLQTAGTGICPRTNRRRSIPCAADCPWFDSAGGICTFKKRSRSIFKELDVADFVLMGCIVSLIMALGYSVMQTNKSLKLMQKQAENPSSLLQKQTPEKTTPIRSRTNTVSPQPVPQTSPQNVSQNFNGMSQHGIPWYKKPPYVNELDIRKNNDAYDVQSKKEIAAKNTSLGIVR